MVEVTEDTVEALEDLAETNEIDFDDIRDRFVDNLSDVQENTSSYEQKEQEKLAYRITRTNINNRNRVPVDEIELATIGGSIRNWNNGDAFVGKALVDENPNDDSGREKIATVIFNEDDSDVLRAREAFGRVGNIVQGEFSVQEADIDDFLVVNAQEETEITVHEPEEDTRSEIIDKIREHVPSFNIENITDNISQRERGDDGELYPASFGVDIRRIEADIYDGYKNEDNGSGTYTVRDETVFDEQDVVESDVYDEENTPENATPGLTCWTDPYIMEYGSDSVVELYGSVTLNNDGIPQMNVDGIVEIMKMNDFDGYEDDGDSGEREVETSVDRTSI